MNKILKIIIKLFNVSLRFIVFLPIIIIISIISTSLFNIFFQNKHYKLKEDINEEDTKEIKDKWLSSANKYNVIEEYKNTYLETLEYFSRFEKEVIFDKEKNNPQYKNIQYIFHIISLAKEAIKHLEEVTADDKKVAYFESNKNSSIDDLIQHYINKLEAKNEDKISTKAARNEIRLRKFIIKLKKHNTLFMNFYLMLFTIYPISNLNIKKEDKDYIEALEDIYEFVRIGHATRSQIHKSVAIQIYKLYEDNISKINLPEYTTDTELKNQIGKLIDFIFQTEKPYKNFNNIEQEGYVKNIVYTFPVFECDNYLSKRQVRRFKFYFSTKNSLVPKYIPKFIRKVALDKTLKEPLSFYQKSVFVTLFGLFRKKI
ncbi:hypothetical protein SMGD1_2531 [Sulfurimonas gotlandica GD1]|uniref:Uncharacterized protein n=1 Tax=Sulfurimonas gotlandica (strain DSM 19862 / JCM 16533 / GD1) TaxID=929558 RepID=B6BNI1_SULGG|nr:hypothetical protein [Sulfurimonas gotlandica]EDZ61327.1 hypothetical protein CBGD1_2393 [Sulfurimonas gotlandica GD1]EHP31053.1 hypothetical protein SMGD1_2531 [Sulfurimonas gotlandica GD1]